MDIPQNNLVVIAGLLSLERIFYTVVCHAPNVVSRIAHVIADARGKEPEFIFKTVHMFKVIQVVAFSMWYYSHFGFGFMALPSVEICMLSLMLLAVGQSLNMLVWYRIGVQGVCYGIKFGKDVPWCTQFPFSFMSDPQYFGAIFTVWGLFLLASESAPHDWMAIPLVETLLYLISMKVEY